MAAQRLLRIPSVLRHVQPMRRFASRLRPNYSVASPKTPQYR